MKTKSFKETVQEKLKGENAETISEKIQKQADSAFKAHIACLTGDTIALEDKVADAEEALVLARINNANTISDRNAYIQNIILKQNNLTVAKQNLESHKETIAFLEEQHKLVN